MTGLTQRQAEILNIARASGRVMVEDGVSTSKTEQFAYFPEKMTRLSHSESN
ncbi:hypothetical protein JQ599_32110 [Bradyrhizobium diazoefficiens]|nr:hypothetical protein [Bradyrhizobium diazoefficiens]MBR0704586.1 hypothetical protein [Bradyrhizobium diazoefficiens]MBR0773154.1 hypothetical protein [Bradyrhizobium diazoefficiens]